MKTVSLQSLGLLLVREQSGIFPPNLKAADVVFFSADYAPLGCINIVYNVYNDIPVDVLFSPLSDLY